MNKMFACVIAAWISSTLVVQGVASAPSYDGKWWLSVDKRQREGFVDGYLACYMFDVKGEIKFEYTGQMYAPRVTDYLRAHPDEQERPAEQLLWAVTKSPYAPPARRNLGGQGETYPGKYGFYDGEFWREMRDSEHLGFIQGFLYCYSKYGDASKGAFSKPAPEYVEAISKWYEIDDEGGINPKKMSAKIPTILFKFRDADPH
jgi:hypothetical protein